MNVAILPSVILEPKSDTRASVIWLHGLGADGHDFEPIVPYLGLEDAGVRFVFPHAPAIPVTINGGFVMPAWYDVSDADLENRVDLEGVRRSSESVRALLAAENARGVPTERIVLAGFSQGGAVALYEGLRHADRLAGILALSTYLVSEDTLEAERTEANRATPVFLAHGTHDPMVPLAGGEAARRRLLKLEYAVTWKTYPMQHEVSPQEIADIGAWLREVLDA
jgi:phospholipase/carboxylesterase